MSNTELKSDSAPVRGGDASVFGSAVTDRWFGYLATIAMISLATAIAVGIDQTTTIPNLSLVFVVPVIVASLSFGLGQALCAAVLGALAFNFFLTEPRYSLAVDDPANVWAIALLFSVGLIVSGVSFTSRQRATAAERLQNQIAVVRAYAGDMRAATSLDSLGSTTSRVLTTLFCVPAVTVLVEKGVVVSVQTTDDKTLSAEELETAKSSLASSVIHAGVYPDVSSRFDFWPVAGPAARRAVLCLAFDPDDPPSKPDELIGIVADILALTLERLERSAASAVD